MKPSDHENGNLWQGFLNIFRSERSRKSSMSIFNREMKDGTVIGAPSSSSSGAGGGSSSSSNNTTNLGEAHQLPNPELALRIPADGSAASSAEEADGAKVLSARTKEEGRKGSRKHSVLSPRGTQPAAAEADEERMRAYLSLESANESDFTGKARKSVTMQLPQEGGGGAGSSVPERKSGGGVIADTRVNSTMMPGAPSTATPIEQSTPERRSSSERGSERRASVDGGLPSGEAVVMRKSISNGELTRASASEWVFGERKRSTVTAAELRGSMVDVAIAMSRLPARHSRRNG